MELLCKETIIDYLKAQGNHAMLTLVESGLFDRKDYYKISTEFVGELINDNHCNGFFESTGDLSGAIITEIKADKDGHSEFIEVTALKTTGDYSKAHFRGSWNDWKAVYELLECWVAK